MTPIASEFREGVVSPVMRRGHELLLLCARTQLDAERADRLRQLVSRGIDWQATLRSAAFHGLLPLVATHLGSVAPSGTLPEVLDGLQAALRANTRRNLALTSELFGLLDAFAAKGVSGIPYKGPMLAALAYGHLGLRDFGDLDVLVRSEDVPVAKDVLIARGYCPRFEFRPAQEASFLANQYEHVFARPAERIVVELQWAVVPRSFCVPLDYAAFWDRVVRVPVGGRLVPSLSPEDLFLVLAVHGAKHLWCRLGWVCDIAELLRGGALDWPRLEERAGRAGARRMLDVALALAQQALDAPLPAAVAARVARDPRAGRLAERTRKRWWTSPGQWPALRESVRFHLAARERWTDRLIYCVRLATVPTPGDLSLAPVPRALSGLYYPVRVVRLAVKYAASARHRLVKGEGRA